MIYPDGYIKVLDVNELAVALEKNLCPLPLITQALLQLDKLLNILYDDKFESLTKRIDKWIDN